MSSYEELMERVNQITSEQTGRGVLPEIPKETDIVDEAVDILASKDLGPQLFNWAGFNRAFGPFRPREFTVLCGTTGAGKTTFLANMSTQLMATSTPHFVASIETGAADYLLRILSVLENRDINSGEPMERTDARAIFDKWKYFLGRNMLRLSRYGGKVNPKTLLCDLLYARERYGCKVAIIDNLNFLMPIVNQNESNSSMDRVVHDFVVFCKNVDMHVIMVMHPRKGEKSGAPRVASEYDIKGSSTVVQEAHNVLLLNRLDDESDEDITGRDRYFCREIRFAKLRRRGKFSGSRIIFEGLNTSYTERKAEIR